jgi:predicted nucleic acid-binding protein
MTIIVDASVWVDLIRDKTGRVATLLQSAVAGDEIVMIEPVRFELLQGCKSNAEWLSMDLRISAFKLLPVTPEIWTNGARLSFECRRAGKTIRKSLDCLIAQMAITHACHLLHNDRDFEVISSLSPLQQTAVHMSNNP